MLIRISQLEEYYSSVDQARYSNFVVTKYIDNITVKKSKKFYKTTLSSDMIFTKDDVSTIYDKVEKLSR